MTVMDDGDASKEVENPKQVNWSAARPRVSASTLSGPWTRPQVTRSSRPAVQVLSDISADPAQPTRQQRINRCMMPRCAMATQATASSIQLCKTVCGSNTIQDACFGCGAGVHGNTTNTTNAAGGTGSSDLIRLLRRLIALWVLAGPAPLVLAHLCDVQLCLPAQLLLSQ